MKINVITLCSGYDSQCMALDILKEKRASFDYDLVAWSEIDKYAIEMHDLVFPQWADRNVGDMTKVDWQALKDAGIEVDLCTYSTPCQDISQAGKQAGLKEGDDTRSAILWKTEELIKVFRPKYLLQENVKALVSKKFLPDFLAWQKRVESYGYRNFYKVLNAKDIGGKIPQNRERVFMVSIREDIAFNYKFPKPVPLEVKLKDILEDEVDSKYFLSDESVGKFLDANNKDKAVFIQFPIEPSHEGAMFVKTWVSSLMRAYNLWDESPEEIKTIIERERNHYFPSDWKTSTYLHNKEFLDEFNYNLERQKGDPEYGSHE